MVTNEKIVRIHQSSVERERSLYSDAQLWARLKELDQREDEILQLLPIAHRLAFSWRADFKSWRRYWQALLDEWNRDKPLVSLLISHLSQRGDGRIADWICEGERRKADLSANAQAFAWTLSDD